MLSKLRATVVSAALIVPASSGKIVAIEGMYTCILDVLPEGKLRERSSGDYNGQVIGFPLIIVFIGNSLFELLYIPYHSLLFNVFTPFSHKSWH
jgi:hypothetical protein